MPYVKSIPIRATVNKSLSYILNPAKTEGLVYTSSMNCMTSAKDAYLEMKSVFESFSSEKYNAPLPLEGKGSVKAIHYIQSFDPKDNVSPELAHRIAKAFARKTFGDDCQVVIATHVDKGYVHSHLIVNAYSLTGRKFNDNQTTLKHVREYSDRVCLAFGIYGFLTRGCPRGCSFCHVEAKEGRYSVKVADLSEFWHGQRNIVLCDPNLIACPEWKKLLQQLIDSKASIDINQGMNTRMMTQEKAEMVSRLRVKRIHFAWDRYEDKDIILPKFQMFKEISEWGYSKLSVFVLTNYDSTFEQDLERVYTLRDMGYNPYIMSRIDLMSLNIQPCKYQ